MKKTIFFIILTIFWIIVLFPREFLWSSFEKVLEKEGVSIETKEVDMGLYLFSNKIHIKDLTILGIFKASQLDVLYDIRNPLHVNFDGNSSYGLFDGQINIKNKKGFVLLKTKKLKDAIFKEYFKKTKEGYKYEFDYKF